MYFYLISNALSPYQKLIANNTESIQDFGSITDFTSYDQLSSQFVFNPFPYKIPNLIQPIDSLSSPKGLINIKFDQDISEVIVSKDWNIISINKIIDGRSYKIPFSSTIDWYLKEFIEKSRYIKFTEVMHKEGRQSSSKRKGQMMEVVGVNLGNLGRASLSLNGNVTVTGNMIFQDQELVRSSLNETQNTHLEFDQKQHLNIQGKIGDRITVKMDQDSERQFEWENNIRIEYQGLEDDIFQKSRQVIFHCRSLQLNT